MGMKIESRTRVALFQETQRFTRWWIWLLLLIGPVIVLYGIVQQVILGHPFGNHPASNLALIITGIIVVVLLPLLFSRLRLTTLVYSDGIKVRFFPLQPRGRFIRFDEIKSFYAREYHPIREYGGWGIKYGHSGMAYNVSGDWGLQLELVSGKKLLIGSQKARELEEAVAAASGKPPSTS
jgi:hypothetical protein